MGLTRLVLGTGMIGAEAARLFVASGDDVMVGSRHGTPVHGARAITLDAGDIDALTAAAVGVTTIVVATNPPYPDWLRDWPPIIDAVIAAASSSGADVVLMGNLYGYGPVSIPMTEHLPLVSTERKGRLRSQLWEQLLAASTVHGFRVAEVRASDYFGPGAGATSHLGDRFFTPVLNSKRAWVVGDPAAAHSWAYLPDIAATIVAAANHPGDWGRAWLVPHAPTRSIDQLVSDINARTGSSGRATGIPEIVFAAGGVFVPFLREVGAMRYQFLRDFTVDSTETEGLLGLRATPWEDSLPRTIASYR